MKKLILCCVIFAMLAVLTVQAAHTAPITDAVYKQDIAEVKKLLENGANVNTIYGSNISILMLAASLGNTPIVQILLDYGADPNLVQSNGKTAIMSAAASGDTTMLKLLIKHGANVSVRDENGFNALFYACKNGKLENVYLLLQNGLSVHDKAIAGITPLHMAAGVNQADLVRLLLERGAPVDASLHARGGMAHKGDTPLMIAAHEGLIEAVKVLLEYKADTSKRNEDGKMARDYAEKNGHIEVVRLLDAHSKPEPSHMTKALSSDNPFIRAACEGRLDTVLVMLKHDIDPNERDGKGYSALMCAAEAGHTDIVRLLMQHGAK